MSSLRLRLIAGLLATLTTLSLLDSLWSYRDAYHETEEIFDAHLAQYARIVHNLLADALPPTDQPMLVWRAPLETRGVGHLAAWNYFMSIKSPENKSFIDKWQAYVKKAKLPGGDKRVTNDPMEATYIGMHMWKQAVEKAGTTDVDAVRKAMAGQSFKAPSGFTVKMDEENHHLHKPVFIGEVQADGQFEIVWKTKGPVRAEPWSPYIKR
ncbi:MAG: hypothetical protein AMXMBFR76_24350 [Pseudomonadota bacterium]